VRTPRMRRSRLPMLIVVFSRDRALQLEGTLASLSRHCADLHEAEILIVYNATDRRHDRQYAELARDLQGEIDVDLVPERRFRRDLLTEILSRVRPTSPRFTPRVVAASAQAIPARFRTRLLQGRLTHDLVLFLVDDNIFVSEFTFREVTDALSRRRAALGFSLRLGRNTETCYAFNKPQSLPAFDAVTERILEYTWTEAEYDFAYPLEVSSSVYRTRELLPAMLGMKFRNPNTLESALTAVAPTFASDRPRLLCFRQSVTFANPINKVQTDYANRSGQNPRYDSRSLARLFEEGYRIDIEKYNGLIPSGVHHEAPLELTTR